MIFKIILLAIIIIFIAIQFVPVTTDNPPVTANFEGPQNVASTFRESCYDCHSNETVWPWYSKVAPVSWLVAGDVEEGREHLNFSEWGNLDAAKQADISEEILEEVDDGEMPLGIYLVMHSGAELDDNDMAAIHEWAKSFDAGETEIDATDLGLDHDDE